MTNVLDTEYYIQGNRERSEEIKKAFEEKGCTLYRLLSNCACNDLIYYSLGGTVRCIKIDNLRLFTSHPNYKELELPVKPEFKVGDWVVGKNGEPFSSGNYVEQITLIEIDEKGKRIRLSSKSWVDDDYIRLWTIEDAKDGDVLAGGDWLFILKQFNVKGNQHKTYCHYDLTLNRFKDDTDSYMVSGSDDFHPVTKEQHDLLFQKMLDAGYKWNTEKKELKKIKSHYDIKNFKPFDKVLVRDFARNKWRCAWFSDYDKTLPYPFITAGADFKQCIPFEGNEHLLGTTDMCDEQYINW